MRRATGVALEERHTKLDIIEYSRSVAIGLRMPPDTIEEASEKTKSPTSETWEIEASTINPQPLVSILLFCKNARTTLRRSIESVKRQTYRNFEYVIQDGASTDGTLEILREYEDKLNIKLVSERDTGPADAFWRALHRCKGDIVATCLADEELIPEALQIAVDEFSKRPYLGAITGDAYWIDLDGNVTGEHISEPFSFTRYLAAEYCPYWSSTFFNMRALRSIGILDRRWSTDSLEFELWCRLAEDYEILYVPKKLSKYAIHPQQLSNSGERALAELKSRLDIIRTHVIRADGVFGNDVYWGDVACLLQCVNLYMHLKAFGSPSAEDVVKLVESEDWLREFKAWARKASIEELEGLNERDLSEIFGGADTRTIRLTGALALYQMALPASIRAKISPKAKNWLRKMLGWKETGASSAAAPIIQTDLGTTKQSRARKALRLLLKPSRPYRNRS